MARQADTLQNWFIGSKFEPPCPPAGTLSRGLVSRLLVPETSTAMLIAPAGFGKTTLLTQAFIAIREGSGQAVWLTLDADDADPKTFLSYLIAAMSHQGLDTGGLEAHARKGFASVTPKAGLAMTANYLNSLSEPVTIFLDDLNLAATEDLWAALSTLIAQASKTTRFVLATRSRPRSGLSRLMSSGRVEILESDDLRFDENEGRELLCAYADTSDIHAIIKRTQGWPVMIQLLKLSLHHHKLRWRDMLSFSGRTTELADYLSEQIAQGMPPHLLHALMRLAICERFDGDLANHLCARSDGWDLIDSCVRQGLLVTSLDAESRWFSFHPLFRDFLVERLRRESPTEITGLHILAAEWFIAQGLPREALRHAKLAGDTDLVVRVLEAAGGWLITLRGGPALMRIIAELPAEILSKNPSLAFGQVYLHIQDGEFSTARRMLDGIQDTFGSQDLPSQGAQSLYELSVATLDALLTGYEGRIVDPDYLSDLREKFSLIIPVEFDALLTHLVGYFQHAAGRLQQARRTGLLAIRKCQDADLDFVEAYAHLWMGQVHLELGELDEALSRFETAIAFAELNFGPDSAPSIAGRIFQAELAYERGDYDSAWNLLENDIVRITAHNQWFSVYGSAYRVAAGTRFRQQGCAAAIRFLDDTLASLDIRKFGILAPYVTTLKCELLTWDGQIDAAHASLPEPSAFRRMTGETINGSDVLTHAIATHRLAMASGMEASAATEFSRLSQRLESSGHVRWLIKCQVLHAICLFRGGDTGASIELFRNALTRANDTRLIGPIVQEMAFMPDFWSSPGIIELAGSQGLHKPIAAALPGAAPIGTESQVLAPNGNMPRLGPREREILALMLEGMTSKEMARATGLAIGTILSYRKSIYRKLEVNSRSHAIAIARNAGYV